MSSVAAPQPIPPGTVPIGSCGRRGTGWNGVLGLIATESALFAYLLFAYAYSAAQLPRDWAPLRELPLRLSGPNTAVLLLSSLAAWWGERGIRAGSRGRLMLGYGLALLLATVFLGVQLREWHALPFGLRDGPYGALFYTTTGFHMAHVAAGWLALAAGLLWNTLGYFDARRHAAVLYASAYWHFVDAVWLLVWFTYYLSPRLY